MRSTSSFINNSTQQTYSFFSFLFYPPVQRIGIQIKVKLTTLPRSNFVSCVIWSIQLIAPVVTSQPAALTPCRWGTLTRPHRYFTQNTPRNK